MLTPDDQMDLVNELSTGGWAMSAAQLRQLQGPYVYVLWRGREVIYVGVKTSSWDRPFNPEHHAIGVGMDIQPRDELTIYPMPSPAIARWAEKVMLTRCAGVRNKHRRHADTWMQFQVPESPASVRHEWPWNNERDGLALAL